MFFFTLVFLSGASALVYEVLWAKYLTLALGAGGLSQSLVLAGMLGGMGLGARLLSPLADRSRAPLRLYAWLEGGIAAWGLAYPFLVSALPEGPARHWAGLATVLPPAFLMGGTLPALVRHLSGTGMELERAVALLYFVNGAGAAAGALASGFLLIPGLGLDFSGTTAAALNAAVALAAYAMTRGHYSAPEESPPMPRLGGRPRFLGAAMFLSGFAALGLETAWTRLLALAMGSSVYSFCLMLAAFIAGFSLGGLAAARRGRWAPGESAPIGLALCAAGLSAAVMLPAFERLPYYLYLFGERLGRRPETFLAFEAAKLAYAFTLTAVPAFFLGLALPMACRGAAASGEGEGRAVGRILAFNASGNFAGALAAGLWLMPALGLRGLIEACVWLLAGAAGLLWWGNSSLRGPLRGALPAAGLAAAGLLLSWAGPWDRAMMSSGAFRADARFLEGGPAAFRSRLSGQNLLFYRDDREATVGVLLGLEGKLLMRINGKTDASLGEDVSAQLLLAHLPLVLKPGARDVLVIGLGSGMTAASALTHPVRSVEIAELSGAVAEGSEWFAPHRARPLTDPRVGLRVADGRRVLREGGPYDLIISEPSNTWIAGMGNLFTVEFFREASAKLRPGGAMLQWIHAYEMDDASFSMVLRSFGAAFPHLTIWNLWGPDYAILGTAEPWTPDFRAMEKSLSREVREDLSRLSIRGLEEILSRQSNGEGSTRLLAGKGPLNEDRFPELEYRSPRAMFLRSIPAALFAHDDRLTAAGKRDLLKSGYLRGKSP